MLKQNLKKKKICLFLRKPFKDTNFSTEGYYKDLFFNNKHKKFKFVFKICPVYSKGLINRLFLIFWAIFNQGDINHICGDINFISLFLKKNKTINTYLDIYSLKRLVGLKKLIYRFFWIKLPILKSSYIISISQKTKRDLNKIYKISDKAKVIDLCVNQNFKRNNKIFKIKKPRILIVGTAINKNIENAINSLKNINCKIIIIGKLKKNIREILIKDNHIYKNYVSLKIKDVIKNYNKSDILLFISKHEGFGLPILEAQSVGRPVITSNLQPMKYVAGTNGAYFVDPNNLSAIKKAILKIIKNKNLRNNLIQNGFENVKRFKKSRILQHHYDIYKKVIYFN